MLESASCSSPDSCVFVLVLSYFKILNGKDENTAYADVTFSYILVLFKYLVSVMNVVNGN